MSQVLTIAGVNHIPGNPLDGNWKVIFLVDDKATAQQYDALLNAFTGKLGGPIKELANALPSVRFLTASTPAGRTNGWDHHKDHSWEQFPIAITVA